MPTRPISYLVTMADLTSLKKLRPCGRLETFSTARHHLGFYKNVACATTYSNPTSIIPPETAIFRALRIVIDRHPMLSVIPLQEDKSYPEVYFARLPSIDLHTCVEFLERKKSVANGERDEELDRVLQEQHNRDFKHDVGSKPFWRLVVLHEPSNPGTFTALWVFHHALADGTSALVFHQTLLSALQTIHPETSETDISIVKSQDTPLLPPLEELHPLPTSALFVLKALLGLWFPSYFAPRPQKLWTGGAVSTDPSLLHAKLRSLVLPSSTTKKLLELSRKNETTMTGTLQCIVASAVLANLDPEKYERVKVDGPISMRRFMKWDGGNIEDEFVSGMTEYSFVHTRAASSVPFSSRFSWDDARGVRAAIQKELDKKGHNSVVGLLRWVDDIHKYFTDQVGEERSNTFEMSNIGVYREKKVDGGGEGGWKIGRCVFSQCPNVAGAAFASNWVTGGDGCAVVAFTWLEGIVEGELMEKMIKSLEEEVEKLLSSAT
ncbi:hypothetical protein K458DRAFT_349031 [Lentithecium fluviatile CBS 122367]|uniref:Alcohol acetyltransferase n=1 Tax=Lentithecium fluviatile CBS 122367 TaxID=1168545 RepID=A0A6G1IJL9_9PLEO|nr:hypothetical protein K458DRAFT_349031 [Lentithecium fluviatile CBS 122367]